MIYSVIPHEMIFREENPPDISYVRRNGVLTEVSNGVVRRIISTDPKDFLKFRNKQCLKDSPQILRTI